MARLPMTQMPLFPEHPVPERQKVRTRLTEEQCLSLIEQELSASRLRQVRWYLDLCWKRVGK